MILMLSPDMFPLVLQLAPFLKCDDQVVLSALEGLDFNLPEAGRNIGLVLTMTCRSLKLSLSNTDCICPCCIPGLRGGLPSDPISRTPWPSRTSPPWKQVVGVRRRCHYSWGCDEAAFQPRLAGLPSYECSTSAIQRGSSRGRGELRISS